MSDLMVIDILAHNDFSKAVRTGYQRRIASWLTRKNNTLLSFEDIQKTLSFQGRHDAGLKVVSVNDIVGSIGTCADFDSAFYPRRMAKAARWVSVNKAYYRQLHLPPIELYKVGNHYFVVDGHHRVSVARARGQVYIDAHVIEIDAVPDFTPESPTNM